MPVYTIQMMILEYIWWIFSKTWNLMAPAPWHCSPKIKEGLSSPACWCLRCNKKSNQSDHPTVNINIFLNHIFQKNKRWFPNDHMFLSVSPILFADLQMIHWRPGRRHASRGFCGFQSNRQLMVDVLQMCETLWNYEIIVYDSLHLWSFLLPLVSCSSLITQAVVSSLRLVTLFRYNFKLKNMQMNHQL